jgi:hypothetical protein
MVNFKRMHIFRNPTKLQDSITLISIPIPEVMVKKEQISEMPVRREDGSKDGNNFWILVKQIFGH